MALSLKAKVLIFLSTRGPAFASLARLAVQEPSPPSFVLNLAVRLLPDSSSSSFTSIVHVKRLPTVVPCVLSYQKPRRYLPFCSSLPSKPA